MIRKQLSVYKLQMKRTAVIILLLCASVFYHARAQANCIYLADFPGQCNGRSCNLAPYEPIYEERYCSPWITQTYGVLYAPYQKMYDCDGDSCVCQPTCFPIDFCAYGSMAECLEANSGTHIICEEEYYQGCEFGGGGSFPPPDCPKGNMCCIGGGGPGSAGGGGSNRGGFGGFFLSLINLVSHSPAPGLEIRYNNKYLLDRGLGKGWSHTYMLTLHEHTSTGNVTIIGETGFGWVYLYRGGGSYESAPYDRSTLNKQGNSFVLTSKNGTKYYFNAGGKLVNIIDLNNNPLTMTYNADGFLAAVSDGFGRSLTFAYQNYNETYHLKTVTDPNNNQYNFLYADDNLSAVVYPDNTQKQFQYNEPEKPNNLNRIIDNNNHVLASYQYDDKGRIIRQGGMGDSEDIEISYTPGVGIFADDFENGIDQGWSTTGAVDITADPDLAHSSNQVAHLHPGSITYQHTTGGFQALKISFDLWVTASTVKDFWIRIYDSTKGTDEYGASVKVTPERNVYSECLYNGQVLREFIKNNLSAVKWHKVEIEADIQQDHGYQYFKIWIDCEYIGRYLFKRTGAGQLDSLKLTAATAGSDIYVDNVTVEDIITDESMVITTDSKSNKEILTISQGNEFGGESWHFERTGKVGAGCTSCASLKKHHDFDGQWNIRRMMDANGIITEMTYDDRRNMLSRTEAKGTPLERTTTYTYHPVFNEIVTEMKASADTPGQNKITTYRYDEANGNLLSETVQGCSNNTSYNYTTTYQYNGHGQRTRVNGPRTDVEDSAAFNYHPTYGYLVSVTYPNGSVTYSGYDANHNVGSITDLNGVPTNYTYDYANRVKTISVGNAITTYEYDPDGNIDQVTMPVGNRVDYEYDSANHVIKITDQLGNYIAYGYDRSGNKIREEIHDAQGALKKYLDFEYDQFNRLSRIKNPDNAQTEYFFDANGNRIGMKTVPGNIITSYEYDELNRLKKVTQAQGTKDEAVTEYQYDTHDNLILVKDAEGKITSYIYDDFGRMIEINSPDTGLTAYAYDEAGNLKTKTDAKGIATAYEYDALNRLTKIDFSEDADIRYLYDEQGSAHGINRLTTLSDASGTTKFFYDERGNATQQQSVIDGQAFITRFEYSRNNEIKKIIYPSGRTIDYQRNSIGQITGVMLDGEMLLEGISYEPFGGLKNMKFSLNGIQTNITFNKKYEITGIHAGNVVNRTYTHDFNGNISSIKQLDALPLPIIYSGTDSYTYKSGKDWIDTIHNNSTSQSYYYDSNGNITSDGRNIYFYNENNQLISLSNKAGYVYNAKSQRIKKIVGGKTIIYLYDLSGNLIEETDQNGIIIASYIYIDSNRIAMVDSNGNISYYHNDHLGTPLAMTSSTGVIVWQAAYTPFGDAKIDSASTVTNNFRFPGQYYDEESGLHYNWHRYYDPGTGRYVTSDPIGLNRRSLYFYVLNDPLNKTDRFGLFEDGWARSGRSDGPLGHSDFPGYHCFDWTAEDHDWHTEPVFHTSRHFRPMNEIMPEIEEAIKKCDKGNFERLGHQGQDYYSHYKKGYRPHFGHLWANLFEWSPDDDIDAWQDARRFTQDIIERWNNSCCNKKCN